MFYVWMKFFVGDMNYKNKLLYDCIILLLKLKVKGKKEIKFRVKS